MIYRIYLAENKRIFGDNGIDQPNYGIPVPAQNLFSQGTYWLKQTGWEIMRSHFSQSAIKNNHKTDIDVEQHNDIEESHIIYQDIFQIIAKNTLPCRVYPEKTS